MNFFQVLKKVGTVLLGIEKVAVPIISAADPALAPILSKLDNWIGRTVNAVVTIEGSVTQAKAGGLKQAAVLQDFQLGIADAQSALAIVGKTIKYDEALYKKVIDDFALAFNDATVFKGTWQIVDLPAAPGQVIAPK